MLANNAFYRIIRKYHTLIGIFVAVHLLVLSLSGLILLFKAEVQHAKPKMTTRMNHREFAEKYAAAHQWLLSQYQHDKPLDIYPDDNNPRIIQARLGINGVNKVRGARIVNIDYQSGQEIQATELPYSQVYTWLLTLHHQLFLGPNGQLYIGMIGIAFILMNITGLLLFLKKRPRTLPRQSLLNKYLYIHQYLGVIALCWGLLVGATGALLAFNPVFTQDFQKNTLQPLANKYLQQEQINQPDVALNTVINTAFKTKPKSVIWYIVFPGMERGIKDHYLVLIRGTGVLSQYMNDYLIISAKSAEIKEIVPLPLLMQLALIATPFHTANYGGILLKIIWTMFALTTLSFIFVGIIIFYTKKRLIHAQNK